MNCKDALISVVQNQPQPMSSKEKQEYWLNLITCYYKQEVKKRGLIFHDDINDTLKKISDWLSEGYQRKPWLVLIGGVGTGKSTAQKAIESWYKYVTCGRKVFGIYTANWISSRFINPEEYEMLFRTPRLMIDDLGTEQVSVNDYGNVRTPIIDLLHSRYNERKITIISTNLDKKQIAEHYGERILDRMTELSQQIIFTHKSYRDERNRAN